jgi:hypothetical protein
MMAWHFAFFAETQHLKLPLNVTIKANTNFIILNVILRRCLAFEHAFILRRYRDKLLTVPVSFALLI